MRILFVGNSATYVHDIPETLARFATEAGFPLESARIVKGGYELAQHAKNDAVWREIDKGYDIVVLQDNGNCISTAEKRSACRDACLALSKKANEAGSKVCFYVRPPYGYEKWGYSPVEQSRELDELFSNIAKECGAACAYVNRAFAYAIENTDIRIWGDDNAHTSEAGAYLAVCIIFSTIFGASATLLDPNGLNGLDSSKELQEIADRIAEGLLPWN